MQFLSLLSGTALVALAAAVPQADTTTSSAIPTATPTTGASGDKIIIFENPNFKGQNETFGADQQCNSLPDDEKIKSIYIPDPTEETEIICQFFDNDECEGEGGDVTIGTEQEFDDEKEWAAIICFESL